MKNYQVTAACVVHIPMATATGITLGTLYRGAVFAGDPDSDKIKHLLDSGMIEEVGKAPTGGGSGQDAEPPQTPAAAGTGSPTVNARSTKAELVEYGIAQAPEAERNRVRAELENQTVKELQARFLQQP